MSFTPTIRPYCPGDETRAVALYNDVYPKRITEAHYRWKLLSAPNELGVPHVWFAETDSRIIAQYAGTPMRLRIRGAEHTVLHMCDAMTAPDYRRKGVMTTLCTMAHESWAAAGIPFLVGLPAGSWGSRREYLGWQPQFPAVWLWHPLRPGTVLARRWQVPATLRYALDRAAAVWRTAARPRHPARDIQVEAMEVPSSELDVLWAEAGRGYETAAVRDAAWLRYRYIDAPSYDYRLLIARRAGRPAGFAVYRTEMVRGSVHGWIADVFAAPDDGHARRGLIGAALDALAQAGASDVRALVPRGNPADRDLRRRGFLRRRGGFDVSIVPLARELPWDVLADSTRWLTMGGDFDVV
jgi:hypothetical protein